MSSDASSTTSNQTRPKNEQELLARFAERWGVTPELVLEVYRMARQRGYVKTHRFFILVAKNQAIPTVRQIRYMARIMTFTRRYGFEAPNYRSLIERKA